jgi:hypothetical protein
MPVDPFDQWFANFLGQDALQVATLLNDKTAIRFLIAWSLFETSCFGGEAKVVGFKGLARDWVSNNEVQQSELMDAANHFHERYQDKKRYGNLMNKKTLCLDSIKGEEFKLHSEIRQQKFKLLSAEEIVFFVIFVVFRYRNNIFHGNKSVASWLKYKDQIKLCIKVMQTLITFKVDALHKAAEQGDAKAQETLKKLSIDRKE